MAPHHIGECPYGAFGELPTRLMTWPLEHPRLSRTDLRRVGEGLLAPAGVARRSDRVVEAERALELLACLRAASFGEQRLSRTKPGVCLVGYATNLAERCRSLPGR